MYCLYARLRSRVHSFDLTYAHTRSFETNIKLPSYTAILQTVLNLFKPKVCLTALLLLYSFSILSLSVCALVSSPSASR